MKLRKYEIDAITNKVLATIRENIKIPSFEKELDKEEVIYDEIINALSVINSKIEFINNIKKKGNTNIFLTKKFINDFNRKSLKKKFIREYLHDKLPSSKQIQEDIVLSNNSDLNDLVNKLVKQYS